MKKGKVTVIDDLILLNNSGSGQATIPVEFRRKNKMKPKDPLVEILYEGPPVAIGDLFTLSDGDVIIRKRVKTVV